MNSSLPEGSDDNDIRPYRLQDVEYILEIALTEKAEITENLSEQQLLEMAQELGISQSILENAVEKWQQRQRRQIRRSRRRRQFQIHFLCYLFVNIFLLIINFIVEGSISWALWCVLGWGIGLGIEAGKTFDWFHPSSQSVNMRQ
ncbi:MAG: 2TM domain-containing protein [Oscillatoria sp. PMC 1068.18]|nr:2TM domain-containing protein [Oscillatoria sp. PMC 1076.18]MEC4987803.1 2TM domain-containing protein [Oscillatoria sp. PMC 1068.18]